VFVSCVGASRRGEAVWACESIASKSRFTNSKSRLGRPGADEKRRGCGGRVPPTHSSTAAWVVGGRRRRAAASGGGGRRATAKIPIYKFEKSIREARRPTKRGGGVGGGCPQPTHPRRPGWWEGGGGGPPIFRPRPKTIAMLLRRLGVVLRQQCVNSLLTLAGLIVAAQAFQDAHRDVLVVACCLLLFGSWLLVLVAWLLALGSLGSWFLALESWFLVLGSRFVFHGSSFVARGCHLLVDSCLGLVVRWLVWLVDQLVVGGWGVGWSTCRWLVAGCWFWVVGVVGCVALGP
jgi:hypothetical protein